MHLTYNSEIEHALICAILEAFSVVMTGVERQAFTRSMCRMLGMTCWISVSSLSTSAPNAPTMSRPEPNRHSQKEGLRYLQAPPCRQALHVMLFAQDSSVGEEPAEAAEGRGQQRLQGIGTATGRARAVEHRRI